jgi:DNA-binding response OmpR family regulator
METSLKMTPKHSHILIVDDNPENIRVLGAALQQNRYKITVAPNGETAVKMAEKHLPDLILLDVMMPDLNGFEVCEILKSNFNTQNIDVVFITAAVTDNDQLKGLSLGAVDYIHKPFSVPIIQAKVALHLERAQHKKDLRLKNEALEEIVKLRDDIERITRHDLKTPLNAIIGYPQIMLMDDNLTDEQREYLEKILRAGSEMNNMINSSLDLFKMETGCYEYNPNWLDVSLLIKTIVRDLTPLINQHNVSVEISQQNPIELHPGQSDNFVVLGEKNLSYSLFANLIRNAIEACPAHSIITINMRYENNHGVISITNEGSVPAEIRDTFFEKYSTAGKSQGTGLGTYSAKLMATTQKGTIAMTTDDKNTCITVRLPYQTS